VTSENHGRRRAVPAAKPAPATRAVDPATRKRLINRIARVTLASALAASIGGVLVAQSLEPEPSYAAPTTSLDLRAGVDVTAADEAANADLSSRSELLGRIALDQVPATTLSIVADGATVEHTTQAATLAEALAEAGVVVDADDITSDALSNPVRDGMSVTIQRVEVTQVTEQVVDSHQSQKVESSSLYVGTEKVTTAGVDGVASHTYRVTMIDGVEVGREMLVSTVAQQRVDEVIAVGTRAKPAPVAAAAKPATASSSSSSSSAPSSGPVLAGSNREIGAALAAARGWTGSQWQCLDSLFQRESGWNHVASNASSGAYGIPQSLPGSKMGTVAADWRTNPATQITWGLNYIAGRYGTPCGAWSHSQSYHWY